MTAQIIKRASLITWPVWILAGALAIRFLAQVAYGLYSSPETFEFDQIARNIITGHGYSYPFFESEWQTFGFPAFPMILALLHALGGGPNAYWLIGIALAVASAALVWVAYSIATHLFDRTAGLVAAVLTTLNPPLLLYAARVHELNLDALLAGAILIAVLDQARSRSLSGLRLGILSGIAMLARPTVVAFAAASLGALALRAPRRPLVAAAAIMLAVALPWSVRNAAVLGTLSPTVPYNCVHLWKGNNPNATGGAITADGRSVYEVMPDDLRARLLGKPEIEQGRIFCEETFQFLRSAPLSGLLWFAEKFVYFWWFPPHAGLLYPKGWIDAYRILWAMEGALVLVGGAAVWRRGSRAAFGIVALQLLIISASQSVGFVEGRHRLLLEPTLSALAAVGLVSVAKLVPFGRLRRSHTAGTAS